MHAGMSLNLSCKGALDTEQSAYKHSTKIPESVLELASEMWLVFVGLILASDWVVEAVEDSLEMLLLTGGTLE